LSKFISETELPDGNLRDGIQDYAKIWKEVSSGKQKAQSMQRLIVNCSIAFVSFILAMNSFAQEGNKNMYYKNIGGLSVAYRAAGQGPVLVLLHGFTIDSRFWSTQIDSLSEKFKVIAWDAPGAGQSSDPPEPFTMNDWADCLAKLLDSIKVKQAHILGLSWGGILAQVFYQRHSQRVLSLVLVDTYAGWKGSLPMAVVEERLVTCHRDASLLPKVFVPKYLTGMFGNPPLPEVQEKLANIMSEFHPIGFRLMAISSAIDTRDILPTIKVPTLLIWGEHDKRSPTSVAEQMLSSIPGGKLEIIAGAGHVSNLEAPAQFNKIVRDFCLSIGKK
jgi:pimeloyl-ACP methyl ester carboxylesterase